MNDKNLKKHIILRRQLLIIQLVVGCRVVYCMYDSLFRLVALIHIEFFHKDAQYKIETCEATHYHPDDLV